jgi:hypothetical protein
MSKELVSCKKCSNNDIEINEEKFLFGKKIFSLECKNCENTEIRSMSKENCIKKWNKKNENNQIL